jgi:hypothetical protein
MSSCCATTSSLDVPHDIYRKHILLPPLTIDQSLLAEANLAHHLELHPTAGVVGAVVSPILGRGSYNVDHCIDQASNNACTIAPHLGAFLGCMAALSATAGGP